MQQQQLAIIPQQQMQLPLQPNDSRSNGVPAPRDLGRSMQIQVFYQM